ncbi:hypothetical protein CCACVL1_28813, partial [Corchorus capsularis]
TGKFSHRCRPLLHRYQDSNVIE